MTRSPQQPDTSRRTLSPLAKDISTSTSSDTQVAADPISDNDTVERPVREKLKKTSIASISQHPTATLEATDPTSKSTNDHILPPHSSWHKNQLSEKTDVLSDIEAARGRPVRKRSFDDLEAEDTQVDESEAVGGQQTNLNGHARKRSRDVRAGNLLREDERPRALETTLQEEPEDLGSDKIQRTAMDDDSEKGVDAATEPLSRVEIEEEIGGQQSVSPVGGTISNARGDAGIGTSNEAADQEMPDPSFSPRKKRSRDQFDSEVDREQKIPATEEARAQRRSDEIDRSDNPQVPVPIGSVASQEDKPNLGNSTMENHSTTAKQPGATSIFPAQSISVTTHPTAKATENPNQYPVSTKSFASSGFAALAQSSTSPFGALGITSTNVTSFSSFPKRKPEQDDSSVQDRLEEKSAVKAGYGGFLKSSPSVAGANEASPFAATESAKTAVFGGSVLGRGFGSTFGTGDKLLSFASSTGDARLGTDATSFRPIGSPKRNEDENETSDGDGEGDAQNEREEIGAEVDSRFQHQNS